MTLSVSSAIQFNNNRGYYGQALKVIQNQTQANPTGIVDAQTVTAIYNWQQSSNRMKKLDADGKLGEYSLGVMIAEMDKSGQAANSSSLRQFTYLLPSGGSGGAAQTGEVSPIISYTKNTNVTAMHLRKDPANSLRWLMKGRFEVNIKLNPQTEWWRYEYRQYIRGNSFTQRGYWTGNVWTARSGEPQKPANNFFQIPIGSSYTWGLTPTWKEDGQIMKDGTSQYFGHRKSTYANRDGIKDMYLYDNEINQNGPDYELQDTYGLEGDYERGLRVMIELYYRGDILKDGKEIVATQSWSFRCDEAINW